MTTFDSIKAALHDLLDSHALPSLQPRSSNANKIN